MLPFLVMTLRRASVLFVSSATLATASALSRAPLPPLPDREGLAGSFAGPLGDTLFVAGGANFPDKRPWEGGTKTWHNGAFLLERGDSACRDAGRAWIGAEGPRARPRVPRGRPAN